ncbi:MAG: EB domain-containing protein, partial [Bauldia sp.]|nr:EB domain-containing protein [Bauldia sp.]
VKALVGQVFQSAFRRATVAIAAAIATAVASQAMAQQAIVKPGSAVVTGYSGFVAYPAPSGGDPFDYLTINTNGPSARVVDLASPGPQGTLSPSPKPFTATAAQVGQVFGVALDSAPQPNIYLAATSAYGLSIYTPTGSGTLKRQRQGSPGAQFVPGQFGPPEYGGGPGAIWRVSGSTGQVSLFSAVGIGSLASLGGLAFDPATQQIFVAERGTGIVYRLGLDGIIRGKYDHGVEGRPGAGLAPVPMAMPMPIDINSPLFSTENPASWGFAAPARRVFALAVYNKRLYYSIAQGPQIWSAGISPSGSIPGSDARLEVEVPSLADGVEITSIAFDGQGRMYLAERGRTTGDYYLYRLANDGQSRVLRYLPKPAGDPAPGRWKLIPEQYSVGLPPVYNNADGGVALNYGYGQNGKINLGACGATVWSTGERLLDPGNGSPPGSFQTVDGLQGNAATLVQPQNVPPTAAWFVDYDDTPGDASFRGYMGAVSTIPCAAPVPQPLPPPVTCPPGTYFYNGQCLIYPQCPPGTKFVNGQCVYPQCPPGYVLQQGLCVPPQQTCPQGTVYYQGQCVPLDCPPGLIRLPNGFCACPADTIYVNGQCVPPNQCPPGAINLGGICFCPLGLILQNNQCLPFSCPAGQVLDIVQGKCVPVSCPPGQELKNGQCVPVTCKPNQDLFNGKCVLKCQQGWVHTMPDGVCAPLNQCAPPQEFFKGQCLNPCLFPLKRQPDGSCGFNIFCQPPNEMWNGLCVPKCPQGQIHTPPNGKCKQLLQIDPNLIQILCLAPKEMVNGECVPPCPPNTGRQPDGSCKSKLLQIDPNLIQILCLAPKEMVNGQCVDPCLEDEVRRPDGTCGPKLLLNPDILQNLQLQLQQQ